MNIVFGVSGVLGAVLSVSWYIVIRSYRQLNRQKFRALHEIEGDLPYPFFKREWELRSRYWRLSTVETALPIVFSLLFVALTVLSYFRSDCVPLQP